MTSILIKGEPSVKVREKIFVVRTEMSSDNSHVNLVIESEDYTCYVADITSEGIVLHNTDGELPSSMTTRTGFIKVTRD